MDSQSSFASQAPAYGTADFTQAQDASKKKPKNQSQEILFVAIIVLVLIVVAVYAMYGGSTSGGGGGNTTNPCTSPMMPGLAAGLACSRGAAGQYAALSSTTPGTAGVGALTGATANKSYTASASSCVDESACQAYCSGDPSCSSYTYNMSAVPSKTCSTVADCGDPNTYSCQAWCPGGADDKCLAGKCSKSGGPCTGNCTLNACPMTGSVCTTYSGALPAQVVQDSATSYTTAGIPATLLPPAKGSFTSRERFVDRCGNFGSDGCPHGGERFY